MFRIMRKKDKPSDYLDEAIYGANDGIITTFAVVSGATGATLGGDTIIILGIANLVADGFSMGASSFLSIRTEENVKRAHSWWRKKDPKALQRSFVTFAAFIIAGVIPLIPFLIGYAEDKKFLVSAVAAGVTFFIVGGLRSIVTKRSFFTAGAEMLTIGGIAAALAYSIGFIVHAIIA